MNPMNEFISRNMNTYIKIADVPENIIDKYKGILPEELIYIWKKMGFGIYENSFLQLINPEDYNFIFEYVDTILEPTIPWGITALGDILFWEGNKGWTIAPDEGNRFFLLNIRSCKRGVIGDIDATLNTFIGREFFIKDKDFFNSKAYLDIKDKLPKLNYGECYGYIPALALGGSKSIKNLKVVDAKAYIHLIGQAVGKIIDYGE
ncbi:T6SS immunity protein Tdi1 domain-containing protein [Pelistega ratti]|nr:T6SS immunity protein Tdi1 domain-containing protein [Pelistega ratti]